MPGPQKIAQQRSQPSNIPGPVSIEQDETVAALTAGVPGLDMTSQVNQFQDTQKELNDVTNPESPLFQGKDTGADTQAKIEELLAANPELQEELNVLLKNDPSLAAELEIQPSIPIGGEFGATAELTPEEQATFAADQEHPASLSIAIERGKRAVFESVSDTIQRTKLSFAGNDNEKIEFLKQRHGDQNVRLGKDGEIFFRRDESQSFKQLDPATFEILDDVLDWSREVVEEAVSLPVAVTGAAIGATAGTVIGTGPVGTAVGAVAGFEVGRAGGIALGMKAADDVADLFGIPSDPERNVVAERAIGTGLSLLVPLAGGLVRSIKNAIKGRKVHIPEGNLLTKQSKEIKEIAEEVKSTIFVQKLGDPAFDNPSTNMLIWQLAPRSARAKAIKAQIGDNPVIQKYLLEQGNAYNEAAMTALRTASNYKGLPPLNDANLVKQIVDIATTIRRAEGKAVGDLRELAVKRAAAKGTPINKMQASEGLTESLDALNSLLKIEAKVVKGDPHLGTVNKLIYKPGNIPDLMARLKTSSPDVAKRFMGKMVKINQKLRNGINLEDQHLVLSEVDDAIGIASSNPDMKRNLQILASNIRKDRNNKVLQALGPGADANRYLKKMGDIQQTIADIDQLASALNNNEMTQTALAKAIFSKGKAGKPNFLAMKRLLQKRHPDTYNQLVSTWMDQLIESKVNRSVDGITGLKSDAILKELNGLGKEFVDEIFEGTDWSHKKLVRLLKFGDRIEKMQLKTASKETLDEFVSKAAGLFSTVISTKIRSLIILVRFGKTENSLILETLSKEGVDKFLGKVPMGKRTAVKSKLEAMLDYARKSGIIEPIPVNLKRSIPEAAVRNVLAR